MVRWRSHKERKMNDTDTVSLRKTSPPLLFLRHRYPLQWNTASSFGTRRFLHGIHHHSLTTFSLLTIAKTPFVSTLPAATPAPLSFSDQLDNLSRLVGGDTLSPVRHANPHSLASSLLDRYHLFQRMTAYFEYPFYLFLANPRLRHLIGPRGQLHSLRLQFTPATMFFASSATTSRQTPTPVWRCTLALCNLRLASVVRTTSSTPFDFS